jgi:hypothetical protein
MNEQSSFEEHGRRLFEASVENLDMRVRSRLTQARHAALDAAAGSRLRSLRFPVWSGAAGVTAAGVLAFAIWVGGPMARPHHAPPVADTQASLEDLDLVAASDGNSVVPMEMLQDDIDFYEWAADKTASSDAGNIG